MRVVGLSLYVAALQVAEKWRTHMVKARLIGFLAFVLVIGILISSGHAFAATRNTLRPNDGTGYFIMNQGLSFSNESGDGMANGSSYQLDTNTIEGTVTTTFDHTLFVTDSSGNMTVYSSGFDATPAQVTQNADGSTSITYSQSSNAVTTSFNGTLSGDQMTVTYQQQSMGGTTVGDPSQEYIGGTDVSATFSTTVNWITSDQIPAAPTNGQYQLSSDGGVILSWAPSSSGGTVTGYNIYRTVFGVDTQPRLIESTTDTSYTDESAGAIQNAQSLTGVLYEIYAVGTSNIENPTDGAIYVAENPMNILNSINAVTTP
jgi:hypothetical protein